MDNIKIETMAYKTCENCGSRIFEYGCVNCNETDYITMQEEYVKPLKTKQTMTELLPGIIGIEVEATGDDIEVIRDQDNYDQQQLKFPSDKYHGLQNYSWVNLPAGSWKYLFLSNSATEEDCKGVVGIGYEDYRTIKWRDYNNNNPVSTALESFRSLLQSHGLENKNLAILKQL